ncbi:MAG: hypothetical protein H6815_03465 [Phycisphaeraceae bacterium]|nr:hypothetical protein [Phycisphaerales bacterium]MCB9859486.1 hypothetical protein [Phycisphaeraceae bacterium]
MTTIARALILAAAFALLLTVYRIYRHTVGAGRRRALCNDGWKRSGTNFLAENCRKQLYDNDLCMVMRRFGRVYRLIGTDALYCEWGKVVTHTSQADHNYLLFVWPNASPKATGLFGYERGFAISSAVLGLNQLNSSELASAYRDQLDKVAKVLRFDLARGDLSDWMIKLDEEWCCALIFGDISTPEVLELANDVFRCF